MHHFVADFGHLPKCADELTSIHRPAQLLPVGLTLYQSDYLTERQVAYRLYRPCTVCGIAHRYKLVDFKTCRQCMPKPSLDLSNEQKRLCQCAKLTAQICSGDYAGQCPIPANDEDKAAFDDCRNEGQQTIVWFDRPRR